MFCFIMFYKTILQFIICIIFYNYCKIHTQNLLKQEKGCLSTALFINNLVVCEKILLEIKT